MKTGLFKIWGITLFIKISALILIALGYRFLPFQTGNFLANFHDPSQETPTLATAYQTWDAQHYLFLAAHGYGPSPLSNVFYPLWPLLIRWMAPLAPGTPWIPALILSNAFALGSITFLFLLVKKLWDERVAFHSCLWSLAFPTAFYSGLIYSESLFLFLTTAFFYYSLKNQRLPSLFCSFLTPLIRPTGLLLAGPALLGFHREKEPPPSSLGDRWLLALTIAAGFGFYLLLMRIWTGDFFIGFNAQKYYIHHNDISHLYNPIGWLWLNFIQTPYSLTGLTTSLFPRFFLTGVILSLPWLYRSVPLNFFIYTFLMGLVPAFSSEILNRSYMRYSSVLFPLFILAALKIKEGWAHKALMAACFLAQIFILIAHSLNYWVG